MANVSALEFECQLSSCQTFRLQADGGLFSRTLVSSVYCGTEAETRATMALSVLEGRVEESDQEEA